MFSHVTVGVSDLGRAFAFYAPVLAELNLSLKFREKRWAAWIEPDRDRPIFILCTPLDGGAQSAGNGQMTAFLAPSRAAVDRRHTAALAAGGDDEGKPGLRPQHHPNYYGAYFRDLNGNKLCVCRHEPE